MRSATAGDRRRLGRDEPACGSTRAGIVRAPAGCISATTSSHDLGFVRRRGVGTAFGKYDARVPAGQHRTRWCGNTAPASKRIDDRRRLHELLTRVGGGQLDMRVRRWRQLALGTEHVREAGSVFGIGPELSVPPGEYTFEDVGVEFRSNRSAALSGSFEAARASSGRAGKRRWRAAACAGASTRTSR